MIYSETINFQGPGIFMDLVDSLTYWKSKKFQALKFICILTMYLVKC